MKARLRDHIGHTKAEVFLTVVMYVIGAVLLIAMAVPYRAFWSEYSKDQMSLVFFILASAVVTLFYAMVFLAAIAASD